MALTIGLVEEKFVAILSEFILTLLQLLSQDVSGFYLGMQLAMQVVIGIFRVEVLFPLCCY